MIPIILFSAPNLVLMSSFARSIDGVPCVPSTIDGCSLGQLTIFCLSLILRAIYDTPSIVDETHGAPSMLHANDNMIPIILFSASNLVLMSSFARSIDGASRVSAAVDGVS